MDFSDTCLQVESFIERAKSCVQRSKAKEPETLVDTLRRWARAYDFPMNPVGNANKKTGVPGTYRPIHNTCPVCPYKDNGCYGQNYRTKKYSDAASSEALPSVLAAVTAIVVAQKFGTLARLHVTGDFADRQGNLDAAYVSLLFYALVQLNRRRVIQQKAVAFTYTHMPEDVSDTIREYLHPWVVIRQSDKFGYNGAVVIPHERIEEFRKYSEYQIAKCPAQLTKNSYQCKDCRVCWEQPEVIVAFDPHGPQYKRALQKSLEVIKT